MYKAQVDPNSLYFDQEYSHAIILGCSIFSIFWGLINIIFVSSFSIPLISFFIVADQINKCGGH